MLILWTFVYVFCSFYIFAHFQKLLLILPIFAHFKNFIPKRNIMHIIFTPICKFTKYIITKSKDPLRLLLIGGKTFSRKIVFLYYQFCIVWLAKKCKSIFPWGKIIVPMMENHFFFKRKGKLFSLSLLHTPLTTSLISILFHHFSYVEPIRKTNFEIMFFIVNCFPWKAFYTENILRPTRRSLKTNLKLKNWKPTFLLILQIFSHFKKLMLI